MWLLADLLFEFIPDIQQASKQAFFKSRSRICFANVELQEKAILAL